MSEDKEHQMYMTYVKDTVEIFNLSGRTGTPHVDNFLEWMKDRLKMKCPTCNRTQYTSRRSMDLPYEVKLVVCDCPECDYSLVTDEYQYIEIYFDRFGKEIVL